MTNKDENEDLKALARDPFRLGLSGRFKPPRLPMSVGAGDLAGQTGMECWHEPERNRELAGRRPHLDCGYPFCVCPCHTGGTPEEIATFVEWTNLSQTGVECWHDAATNPHITGHKPHVDCRLPFCVCPCHEGGTPEEIAAFIERTKKHGRGYSPRR